MRFLYTALFLLICTFAYAQQPIQLEVDATDAPRRIFHTTVTFPNPASTMVLHYPKWFPGTHAPTGKVVDLVGLRMIAAGRELRWRRDPMDVYTFQCEVPAGAASLEVKFDFVTPTSTQGRHHPAASSSYAAMIDWFSLLMYPRGADIKTLQYSAALKLPADWKYGTALRTAEQTENLVKFAPVSLYTLVDSPVVAGEYFRTVDLSGPDMKVPYRMHIAADTAAALEMKPEIEAAFRKLGREEMALFGARHFEQYNFLVTLSDLIEGGAVEHHESSDNRPGERFFIDEDAFRDWVDVLPHEMVHAWNGKYKRPAGLDVKDYQQQVQSELLWVYEGLTNYLGYVLAARSGLMSEEDFRGAVARIGGWLDHQSGRSWRPLVDTTVSAQVLSPSADKEWAMWRRGLDYYDEGVLIWLEADVLIRQKTNGRASLDDFCRSFFGPPDSVPRVSPYTLEDVISAMNQVVAHDWKTFFETRVEQVQSRAPLGGIENAGWRLQYSDKSTAYYKSVEKRSHSIDERYSLGIVLKEDGSVLDVAPGSPAANAGLAPGMKVLGVAGRSWSETALRDAVRSSATQSQVELLVANGDFYKILKITYKNGARYPTLERDSSRPDILGKILKALT